MSLLLAEGHVNAPYYPVGKVWHEAMIARERIATRIHTESLLIHAAMVAVVAPKGKGVKQFEKLLKGLQNGN